ncbi:hypothetical protein Tco_0150252 [Tanacetum coccineum]
MEEEHNQPEVLQELLLKLINDLQILKGIQQEKKKPTAQSSIPYWNSSMIDDEEARDNFLKDVYTFLKKFSRIPFGVTPKQSHQCYAIEEPDNSLSMGDEHLDTISSVEILVPIPSEFKGISDDTCDVPVCGDSSTFDALKDNSEILSNSNDDDTSSDDDDFEDVEYVSLEEIEPDQEGLISIDISDNSNNTFLELPEFESFHFDPSFPRPPPEPPDAEICLNFESDTPVIGNFEELNEDQRGSENVLFQNVEDDDTFTLTIRTFLPFLTYPEASPLSCSTGSEDTIFDPGIFT